MASPKHAGDQQVTGTSGGRLTEDEYLCPPCFRGDHNCKDLFVLQPFGLISCACQPCGAKLGVPQ